VLSIELNNCLAYPSLETDECLDDLGGCEFSASLSERYKKLSRRCEKPLMDWTWRRSLSLR